MIRTSVAAVALLALLACEQFPDPGCGPAALCALPALRPTLVVTGLVRASANPLAGVLVRLTAHHDSCSGNEVLLRPSPSLARTDSNGVYQIQVEPTQTLTSACLRVAYSDALFTDTTGVRLRVPPAPAETVRVNITAP
jgi:hypothetical protein